MSPIRLLPEEDFDNFIFIVANAYPGWDLSTEEKRQSLKNHLLKIKKADTSHLYGVYQGGRLVGGMVLDDFIMTLFSVKTLVGGVGLVAVDLVHKKEKVCKDMITFSLKYYHKKGACLTSLYPFRPDFYKRMGFGFGTKMHQYRVRPSSLPRGGKDHIFHLDKKDKQLLIDCYNRYTEKTHGMMEKLPRRLETLFEDSESKIVGYKDKEKGKGKEKDKVSGYLLFTFKKRGDEENFLINDLQIEEFIYENREAFSELLTFLHLQDDQVRHIIFNTQDEYFHHLFSDPRDHSLHVIPSVYHQSNVSGVGIMYRVIDVKRFFEILKDHNFKDQTCKLKISIRDSFFHQNEGEYIVHFKNGKSFTDRKDYEVNISMDISDFSPLVLGVVPFDHLYQYGLAEISDADYIDVVTRIFSYKEKPVCTTRF